MRGRIQKKGPLILILSIGLSAIPLLSLRPSPSENVQAPLPRAVSSLPSPPSAPGVALQSREKKILGILSNFKTGLKLKQKERLAVFINEESRRYGFDPELIVAIISAESSFYNWAASPMGAVGLMQIIPATGKEVAEINHMVWDGEGRLLDPFVNIRLGIHYFWTLYLRFGSLELALTAYNNGPSAVARWILSGERIPTRYAKKVLQYYQDFLEANGEPAPHPEREENPEPSLRF